MQTERHSPMKKALHKPLLTIFLVAACMYLEMAHVYRLSTYLNAIQYHMICLGKQYECSYLRK